MSTMFEIDSLGSSGNVTKLAWTNYLLNILGRSGSIKVIGYAEVAIKARKSGKNPGLIIENEDQFYGLARLVSSGTDLVASMRGQFKWAPVLPYLLKDKVSEKMFYGTCYGVSPNTIPPYQAVPFAVVDDYARGVLPSFYNIYETKPTLLSDVKYRYCFSMSASMPIPIQAITGLFTTRMTDVAYARMKHDAYETANDYVMYSRPLPESPFQLKPLLPSNKGGPLTMSGHAFAYALSAMLLPSYDCVLAMVIQMFKVYCDGSILRIFGLEAWSNDSDANRHAFHSFESILAGVMMAHRVWLSVCDVIDRDVFTVRYVDGERIVKDGKWNIFCDWLGLSVKSDLKDVINTFYSQMTDDMYNVYAFSKPVTGTLIQDLFNSHHLLSALISLGDSKLGSRNLGYSLTLESKMSKIVVNQLEMIGIINSLHDYRSYALPKGIRMNSYDLSEAVAVLRETTPVAFGNRIFVSALSGSGKTYLSQRDDKIVDADTLPAMMAMYQKLDKEFGTEWWLKGKGVYEAARRIADSTLISEVAKWLQGPSDGKILMHADDAGGLAYAKILINPSVMIDNLMAKNVDSRESIAFKMQELMVEKSKALTQNVWGRLRPSVPTKQQEKQSLKKRKKKVSVTDSVSASTTTPSAGAGSL
jgi:hypothetical protein